MAENTTSTLTSGSEGRFVPFFELLGTDTTLQAAIISFVAGIVALIVIQVRFVSWLETKKISYERPEISGILKKLLLPGIAIIFVSVEAHYIQVFELFDNEVYVKAAEQSEALTKREFFAKILNTAVIMTAGYMVSQLISVIMEYRERVQRQREDFEAWEEMRGFPDDKEDFFHKVYRWIMPVNPPEGMDKEEFEKLKNSNEGRKYLERFVTSKGFSVGSYKLIVDKPFKEWKNSEFEKYKEYLEDCLSGDNQAGRSLSLASKPAEVHTFDSWREAKRLQNYEPIVPGLKPPGHISYRSYEIAYSKPLRKALSVAVFAGFGIGIVAWWGVDLVVLATTSGGLAIGVGFALREAMENYFAYISIRKDNIVAEGDRVEVEGYNGIVHRITTRVTYIRHGLNESVAIIPTKQLVTSKIINYTKDFKLVPAILKVGVSYLNDPEEVASVLLLVGKKAMREIKDTKGRHLVVQEKCPYLEENKTSCGCDQNLLVDLEQPTIRFNEFNESSLEFALFIYVRDFGSQFRVKSVMRIMMYKEFKKYGIKIPWTIRTVYQGDEAREQKEISRHESERKDILKKHGIGDLEREPGEEKDSSD